MFNFREILFERRKIWNIGICNAPISSFIDASFRPTISWLPFPAKNTFIADPFPLFHNNKLYVFVEEFDFNSNKGHISVIEQKSNGTFSKPVKVMSSDSHMSFPFIIKHQGEIYCIPETYQAGQLNIYKATTFPYKWEKEKTLLSLPVVDPVIFFHNNNWWLFYTLASEDKVNEELYISYSSSLTGSWLPHSLNPVKTDITSSRSAGTPFTYNGALYRPAQNCINKYGEKISLNKIIELTTTTFKEEIVNELTPILTGKYSDGVHTISGTGNLTVVDARTVLPVLKTAKTFLKILNNTFHN